ncbi:acyltransferase family protein [Pelagicoccus albus]|uniref:Acyltransferase n=1 Tax=Pelagicoccus albus TaxID=415222 RepID=A0A7X1B7X2_9BACT|nr:acyltransferase family protein [Pelagicoccus albus]MBC2607319.1 acyltransferase [Pelagicoccus albus]
MLKYRPDIDGLRSIAVLPVVLFHAGLGFPGGFVGVDIFFVISGFLITSIILKDLKKGTFSLARFWERRIRRIVPAMSVVTFSSLLAGWFFLMPDDLIDLGKVTLAQVAGVANFYLWLTSGYFSVAAELKPFLHYWSLAVEEQYYVVFPLILVFVAKYGQMRFFRTIIVIFAVGIVVGVVGTWVKPNAAFYLLPTRAWELMVGSILAALPYSFINRYEVPRWIREAASLLGMGVLFLCFFQYDHDTPFPGVGALPPVLATGLIIWGGEKGNTWLSQILSLQALLFIGLISYSLYLWHWPVMAFSRHILSGEPSLAIKWGMVLASFVLAVLSWKYIEGPFRKAGTWLTRKQVFSGFAFVSVSMVLVGCLFVANDGFKSRIGDEHLRYRAVGIETEFGVERVSIEMLEEGSVPELSSRENDVSGQVDLLLWGDSHGGAVSYRLAKMCQEAGVNAKSAYREGLTPLLGYETTNPDPDKKAMSIPWNEAVFDYIKEARPRNVLLVGYWAQGHIEYPDQKEEFATQLLATVSALNELGTKVWIMRTVPIYEGDLPKRMVRASMNGSEIEDLGQSLEEYREKSSAQDEVFDQLVELGVTILDPEPHVTEEGRGVLLVDDKPVYFDNHHFTRSGTELLEPVFEPLLEACAIQ